MTSSKRSGFSPLATKFVGFVALALTSLGGTGIASARAGSEQRGRVETHGPAAKMVVQGPIALHAYSEFRGASLYTAPAVTGTDRDCQGAAAAATPLAADQIATITVGEGQVACLATTARVELLWHAVSQPVPAPVMLAKTRR